MQRGQKRAQTMRQMCHLGLMYMFFFSCIFFIINSCIIGSAYQITMEKGSEEGNGPNNVSDALFGPYVHVFFFLTCFFIIGSCILGFTYQLMMEKVVTRETGPNDASDTLFGPYVRVF